MTTEPSGRTADVPLYLRQDFVGGLVIIAIAVFAFWQGWELPMGTFGGMGPGMLPQGPCGAARARSARCSASTPCWKAASGSSAGRCAGRCSCSPPSWRSAPPCARSACVIAGPLAIVIGAFASSEVRWGETLIVGAIMTVFCIGLFKFALGLPIPLAPWLLGY